MLKLIYIDPEDEVENGNTSQFEWTAVPENFRPNGLQGYRQRRGVLVDTTDFKPVDYFKLYFTNQVFEIMAEETNRYATQSLDKPYDFPPHSRFNSWVDTTSSEMKVPSFCIF